MILNGKHTLFALWLLSCGQTVQPQDGTGASRQAFVGRWLGSGQTLRIDHPICARTPATLGGLGNVLANGCVADIANDPVSQGLKIVVSRGGYETFELAATGGGLTYHSLIVESSNHATFVERFESPDAGFMGSPMQRIGGVADLEGEVLILRLCWSIRRSIAAPPEIDPIECRLRRIR